MRQVSFQFGFKSSYSLQDFIVSASNRDAFNYIMSWPNWGDHRFARMLYIYGPDGSGKTHLSHIWKGKSGAEFADLKNLKDLYNKSNALILDNIEDYLDCQDDLFHLINIALDRKFFLLITSRCSPGNLDIKLPDLRSRINAITSAGITNPDYELLSILLIKHFSDRQLKVSQEVINFIIARIERSFEVALKLVKKVDELALAQRRKITIPLIKEALRMNNAKSHK
jgi:chromosomal replication initiation ATPase DnaA